MALLKSVAFVAAGALLLALGPWPYGYYMLLRVLVFAAGVFCAINLWYEQRSMAVGLFLCAAIFNPFLPAHLNRELWSVLNVAGAALFGFTALRAART